MTKHKNKRNAEKKYKSFGNKIKFNGLHLGNSPVLQIASAFLMASKENAFQAAATTRWQQTGHALIPWDIIPVHMIVCFYNRGTQTYDILPEARSAVARLGFSADKILDELLHSVDSETNMPVIVRHETEDIIAECTAPLNVICSIINKELTKKIKNNAS